MIQRELAKALIQFSTQYPVVTVTGPRQSGKTTLVKSIFTNHQYCNLENPKVRLLAEEDPKGFFNQF